MAKAGWHAAGIVWNLVLLLAAYGIAFFFLRGNEAEIKRRGLEETDGNETCRVPWVQVQCGCRDILWTLHVGVQDRLVNKLLRGDQSAWQEQFMKAVAVTALRREVVSSM